MTLQRITNLAPLIARTANSVREAMCQLDRSSMGIVLVCDQDRKLLDTVTDGDVRRAILDNVDLDAPLWQLYGRKAKAGVDPITASEAATNQQLTSLMSEHSVRHLPLVNAHGQLVALAWDSGVASIDHHVEVQAVVMAGGFGTRLRPLTDHTPKPMLSVGGKPLLERTVQRLRDCGIRQVHLTTHYLPEQIESHFGNGSRFGVEIEYLAEKQPLGTAGSLNLVPEADKPLIVINGDILTSVDFSALVDFHRERDAEMTVGVRQYEFKVPYGVIEADQGCVKRLREKPKYEFLVNAGIYLIQPTARQHIPDDRRFDMTDLIDKLMDAGQKVVTFPVVEYWLDIGQIEDFQQAQQDVQQMRWAA